MPISFQKTEIKPMFALPEKGPYFAKITAAEFKRPDDVTKSPYLNLSYEIYNSQKEKKGVIFDMLSTSEHPFCQQRMGRFITAIGLAGKTFNSYEEICKVIKERKLGFFITPDVSEWAKNNPDKARMVVDSKDEGIYYTTEEIANYMPDTLQPKQNKPTTDNTSTDSAPIDVEEDF